jgi:hypothetical protein
MGRLQEGMVTCLDPDVPLLAHQGHDQGSTSRSRLWIQPEGHRSGRLSGSGQVASGGNLPFELPHCRTSDRTLKIDCEYCPVESRRGREAGPCQKRSQRGIRPKGQLLPAQLDGRLIALLHQFGPRASSSSSASTRVACCSSNSENAAMKAGRFSFIISRTSLCCSVLSSHS